MKRINVLLFEECTFFQESLKALIGDVISFDAIYCASALQEARSILTSYRVDLVFRGTSTNDLETLHRLRQEFPYVPVLVLSDYAGGSFLHQLSKLNIHGILLKTSTSKKEIVEAVESITNKQKYFTKSVKSLLNDCLEKIEIPAALNLSRREFELIKYFKKGFTCKQIASQTRLSVRTVESYRKSLLHKTRCPNTASLLAFAFQNGLTN